ncbi:hypothetical protein ACM66B_002409 [Microbotryomycetes sp. NB124-2]
MSFGMTSASDGTAGGGGSGGTGMNLPSTVLTLATASAAFSTVLSVWTVWLQLKNYRKIRLQRLVVRILIMVPVYSISSLVSLYYLDLAFFVDAVRDMYEGVVIYCFFFLLVEYLGGERSLISLLHGREPVSHPWPIKYFYPPLDASDPFTYLGLKRSILQYVQLKPVLVAVTFLLKLAGTYKDGSLKASAGYTYVSIVYNLSVSISLYALAMLWVATHEDLKPFRPVPKFLCVKGIIFFSFWQGFAVSILVAAKVLRSDRYDTEMLSLAVQDTLMCLEMPLFAFLHLYAFSYTDYIDRHQVYSGRLPVWYAIRDVLGYKDVLMDSVTALKGSGFSYRTFEPAAGGIHVGRGQERRAKAGLRYKDGGKKKYWLAMPGDEEADAYGRKGHSRVAARPLHSVRQLLVDRFVDEREAYAPIPSDEASQALHRDGQEAESRLEEWMQHKEGERAWQVQGAADLSDESDAESVGFDELERDETAEALYRDARRLEFGDWSYPVIDASREDVRRRMYAEEEGRLQPKRHRGGKGKEREQTFVYGRLAERSPASTPKSLRASARDGDSDDNEHPTERSRLLQPARQMRNLLTQRREEERERRRLEQQPKMPADAIDLIVEDCDAEEQARTRDRRRGEPGGKTKRVYRQVWHPPAVDEASATPVKTGQSQGLRPSSGPNAVSLTSPIEGETIQVLDEVPREPGETGSSPGMTENDSVVRIIVKEDEMQSRLVSTEARDHDEDETSDAWRR